jgi:chorismate mutase-like protein
MDAQFRLLDEASSAAERRFSPWMAIGICSTPPSIKPTPTRSPDQQALEPTAMSRTLRRCSLPSIDRLVRRSLHIHDPELIKRSEIRFITDNSRKTTAVRMRNYSIIRDSTQCFSISARCVAAVTVLVLALYSTSLCPAADVGVTARADLAKLDHLLQLMKQRLTLMHDVARWKWNANQPIAAPERELLESVVRQGRAKGLDARFVRTFFAAQIEAARSVERADFDHWKSIRQRPFATTTSLGELRQRIDDLNRGLLNVLAELYPALSSNAIQKALRARAEAMLTGDDLAPVRKTAIGPLRR